MNPALPKKPQGTGPPTGSPTHSKSTIHPWFPYALGTLIGLSLWPWIHLPFHNPEKIVGFLALASENPMNASIRFAVLLLAPLLLLAALGSKVSKPKPPTPVRPSTAAKGLWVVLAFALVMALNVPTYHASGRFDPYHEGESLGSAMSDLGGLVPYRDFGFVHGLIEDPLRTVMAFKLWGPSIGAERAFQSLLKMLTWLLAGWAAWRLTRRNWASAVGLLSLLVLLYPGMVYCLFLGPFLGDPGSPGFSDAFLAAQPYLRPFEWVLVPPRDLSSFAFIGCGIALPMALSGAGKSPRLVAGTAFLFSFLPFFALAHSLDRGVFLLAAWLLWTSALLTAWWDVPSRRNWVLATVAGALAGLLFLGALLGWDYASFARFAFGRIPATKDLSDGLPIPIQTPHFILGLLFVTYLPYRLVGRARALWDGRLPLRGNLQRILDLDGPEILLALLTLLFFRSAIGRSDAEHLAYVFWLPVWAWASLGLRSAAGPRIRKPVLAAALLLALGALVGLIRLPLVSRNFPLSVPDSVLIPQDHQTAVAFLRNRMGPGDLFYTFTSEAAWYYYLRQPCPAFFPCAPFNCTDSSQREAAEALERKKVEWVLYRNGSWSGQLDGISNEDRMPALAAYLRGHYAPATIIGDQEIWRRK